MNTPEVNKLKSPFVGDSLELLRYLLSTLEEKDVSSLSITRSGETWKAEVSTKKMVNQNKHAGLHDLAW